MKNIKKLIRGCLIGLIFATGCSLTEDEAKVLIMGTSADFEPFEFFDLENNNEIIGFDVDLARHIAQELGYELKVIDMDFNSLTTALRTGKVDLVLAGMSATPERKEVVDFTHPYYLGKNILVTNQDMKIKRVEDLNGLILGVQTGSIQEEAMFKLQEAGIHVQLNSMNRLPDLFLQLNSERVQAVVMTTSAVGVYLNNDESLNIIDILEPSESLGSAIAVQKGSELTGQINEILDQMKENGELDALIEKWFY